MESIDTITFLLLLAAHCLSADLKAAAPFLPLFTLSVWTYFSFMMGSQGVKSK